MPQGPVGRGCEACRAQKKKCDLKQPACSRCQRLRIPCKGCGEKRFKFTMVRNTALSREGGVEGISWIDSVPANKTIYLRQDLVARLHQSNDVRYDMMMRWGGYLTEIPKMLGSNEALDAATAALLARHTETSLRLDQSDMRAPAIIEYNKALAALRRTLDDSAKASSIETLAAVVLLTFCQARSDDQFTFFWSPHAQGLAQLTRMRGFPSGRDMFEKGLFAVIHSTLIIQSLTNPDFRLSELESRKLAKAFTGAGPMNPAMQHQLLMIKLSRLMQRGREAIASGTSLDPLASEAGELQQSLETLSTHIKKRLKELEVEFGRQLGSPRLHALCLGVHGVVLATRAMLLCAKGTLAPDCSNDLPSASLCEEVLQLIDETKVYRPQAACWTFHTLLCMWCATQDDCRRARVEETLLDNQRDAMGPQAELQMDKLRLLERRLWLLE